MINKTTVREEKRMLRRKYSALRAGIPPHERLEKSRQICESFLNTLAYKHADTVLLYYSINNEVNTHPLIEAILGDGKRVALPVCLENSKMVFRYINSMDTLKKGLFSALEPDDDCEEFTPSPRTICVIPAIAFDRKGYRLGYGKGYYDRYLTDPSIVKIGFCYDALLVDSLPRGRFDLSCDLVITERGVFNTDEK